MHSGACVRFYFYFLFVYFYLSLSLSWRAGRARRLAGKLEGEQAAQKEQAKDRPDQEEQTKKKTR